MQILVSVIIPVYNTQEYLRACVASANMQSQIGLEIILVDDGSTDGSGTLCDQLAAENRSITHTIVPLHKENGGSASARNFGVAHAKGEYLLFLDSDDTYLTPDVVSTLYNTAKQTQTDVLCFQYTRRVDRAPVRAFPSPYSDNLCQLVQDTIYTSSACLKLMRTEALRQHDIAFVTGQHAEDILFCGKLLAAPGLKIAFINKVFYYYRVRKGSHTTVLRQKTVMDTLDIIKDLLSLAQLDPAAPPTPEQGATQPLLAYAAFQYATLLINIHLCSSKLPKKCLAEVYQMQYLLGYNRSNTVRAIALCAKCVGIRATSALLATAFRLNQVLPL